eukprot:12473894-Heterocapsa_arctica.AAC.1
MAEVACSPAASPPPHPQAAVEQRLVLVAPGARLHTHPRASRPRRSRPSRAQAAGRICRLGPRPPQWRPGARPRPLVVRARVP